LGYKRNVPTVEFAELLKKWRGTRYQKEAAEILGVPIQTLRKWEYGKRTPKKITQEALKARMNDNRETT